jgi:predicted transcriptional regulator
MLNAEMARKNVKEYENGIIAARVKKVMDFLENTVNAQIVENSRQGFNTCRVTKLIDKRDVDLAIEKLEELGYNVERFSHGFVIEW